MTVAGSFLLGALGWLGLEFVGRPIRGFFDLRRWIGTQLWPCFQLPQANSPEDEPTVLRELEADRSLCRDLSNQLIAFAETEPIAFVLKWWGYDAVMAGLDLRAFANQLGTVEDDRLNNMWNVLEALRIRSGSFPIRQKPKEF